MMVKARFSGHQLGHRLVEHVLDWPRCNAMPPRVTLLADKDNSPALAFYERRGFAPSAMKVLRRAL